LIVSLYVRNRLVNDVIVVPISTTLRPSPTHVELPKNEAGLDLTSMAKCEQITTLDTWILYELEAPICKAFQGAAIVSAIASPE